MISRLIPRINDLGLTVLTYPANSTYAERSVMDQLICAHAEIFIGTCGSGTEFISGSVPCRKPRNLCGNYGEWIIQYRTKHNMPTVRV